MASTVTIQNTINWTLSYLEQQPVTINGLEPALSSANLILQTMLNPPFVWNWNRKSIFYTATTQDTLVVLPDYGFLEGGSWTGSDTKPFPLSVQNLNNQENTGNRPAYITPLIDDGLGNQTFRLVPNPFESGVVNLIYQKKAPFIQSLGFTWSPVPDEKRHIYQWGFLALMSLIGNDSRFNEYNQKFVLNLLSAQGGLSEMEKNVWIGNWTKVLAQLQGTQLGVTQRYKSREG